MNVTHTPTPWATYYDGFSIGNEEEGHVATCENAADADFIVRSCNAHDKLVAACREMLRYETGALYTDERSQDEIDAGKEAAFKQIRAALAAAGEPV